MHHILAAVQAAGPKGASRASLETWIQTTFRSSGQATYVYLKDLRTRRWAKEDGGRYVLTEQGALELRAFREESSAPPLQASSS